MGALYALTVYALSIGLGALLEEEEDATFWPFLLKNLPKRPLELDDDEPELEAPSGLKLLVVPPEEVASDVEYSPFLQFCLIQFLIISVIWNCNPNCSA